MGHGITEYDKTYGLEAHWHGLNKVVPEIDHDTVKSVVDIPIVERKMAFFDENEDGTINLSSLEKVDGQKAVVADLTSRDDLPEHCRRKVTLHVPKESYRIIPNSEIWKCVQDSISGIEGVKIVSVGTLDAVKKFFVSVELNGGEKMKTEKGDVFQAILNFLSSHDGTLNLLAMDSFTRTVCMNTFRANSMYEGGAFKAYVPHTKNAGVQIENLSAYLNTVLAGRKKVMEAMNVLETLSMSSPSEAAYVAAGYFTAAEATEMSTTAFNRCGVIRDLSLTGKGNNGKTRADLFNGFTEYFTHYDGAGGKKASKAERWNASEFGQAASHKESFLELVLDESRFQETASRGEKLYRDKQALVMA